MGGSTPVGESYYARMKKFTLRIGEKGWLRNGWPEEYGGLDLSPVKIAIIQEEMDRRNAVIIRLLDLAGMVLSHGTKQQKDYWLPPLGRGEIATCLVQSEPDAGSDLANCKCRADLRGDHFIVNGQKHYVSQAQRADYGQLLVVTDPQAPRRRNLSRVICDMHAPGVTVRPQRDMAGEVELNEVWFEDARIPKEWLVGKPNNAWLEMNQDVGWPAVSGRQRDTFEAFLHYYRAAKAKGDALDQDGLGRRKLAALYVEQSAMAATRLQGLAMSQLRQESGLGPDEQAAEGGVQTAAGSMEPLMQKEWRPKFAQTVMEILGPVGQLGAGSRFAPLGGWPEKHYRARGFETHAHGTIEVLKMVIATRGLGLPRG